MKDERTHRLACRGILLLTLVLVAASADTRAAQVVPTATLPRALIGDIDAIVAEVLEATGVPSASIAVVHDGAISLW